jgi:hypothetical protein
VFSWLPMAVMTESGHASGEGGWGTAAPACRELILGVGEEVANREWSSTVAQSSGGESASTGRRGGGGHRG